MGKQTRSLARAVRSTLTRTSASGSRSGNFTNSGPVRSLASLMAKFRAGAFRGFALDADATYTAADWDALAATGSNVVRAPIRMTRSGAAYLAPNLTWALDVLVQCGARNIGVIIVLVPLPDANSQEWWATSSLQTSIRDRWVAIANTVKGYGALVAYDVLNEPATDAVEAFPYLTKKAEWLAISQPWCSALRAADADTPIIWEPWKWAFANGFYLIDPPVVTGLVLSIHWYGTAEYCFQAFGANIALPAEDFTATSEAVAIAARLGHPIYVGEFGAYRWSPTIETWFSRCTAYFNTQGWSWSVHVWRPSYEGFDIEIPAGAAFGITPRSAARSPTSPALLAIKAGIAA